MKNVCKKFFKLIIEDTPYSENEVTAVKIKDCLYEVSTPNQTTTIKSCCCEWCAMTDVLLEEYRRSKK